MSRKLMCPVVEDEDEDEDDVDVEDEDDDDDDKVRQLLFALCPLVGAVGGSFRLFVAVFEYWLARAAEAINSMWCLCSNVSKLEVNV